MSTEASGPRPKAKKKPRSTPEAVAKPARTRASPKKKSAVDVATPSRSPRLCGSCQGKVSNLARYCRHCGKALSSEVPANPHLPPPPKPWRPSRIPKQRPAPPSPVLAAPIPTHEPLAVPPKAPAPAPKPVDPKAWDPVPEVEQRLAQLRALHERLRPQLARAELFKRRLRMP